MYVRSAQVPVFGAMAAPRAAVGKLQTSLRLFASQTATADYFPGRVDDAYGINTHAAIIRVARDFLVPLGALDSRCVSTCNSLHLDSRSYCGGCLRSMLQAFRGDLPSAIGSASTIVNLTDAEIDSVVAAYGEWLDAYVREGGGADDAASLVEATTGEAMLPPSTQQMVEQAMDADAAGGGESAIVPVGPAMKKGSMPWWGWAILLGTGSAIVYAVVRSRRESAVDWAPAQWSESRSRRSGKVARRQPGVVF